MNKKTIRDIDLKGKKVFVRCDFNVPLDENGNITDNRRIVAALPTIKYLLDQNCKIILASHLGRPKGEVNPKFSLKPVATELSKLLGKEVKLAEDVVGPSAKELTSNLKEGEIVLLENVRFDAREEKNEIEFRYRVVDGKADKSYGINVAKLAHLPKVVLDRAAQLLSNYENQETNQSYQPSLFVMDQVQPEKSMLLQRLQELDIDSMSPREALDCLYELKKLSEKIDS